MPCTWCATSKLVIREGSGFALFECDKQHNRQLKLISPIVRVPKDTGTMSDQEVILERSYQSQLRLFADVNWQLFIPNFGGKSHMLLLNEHRYSPKVMYTLQGDKYKIWLGHPIGERTATRKFNEVKNEQGCLQDPRPWRDIGIAKGRSTVTYVLFTG